MRVITLARKPLSETNVASNVLKYGTGALNIDASRIGTQGGVTCVGEPNFGNAVYGKGMGGQRTVDGGSGRWPPNLILQHLPECHIQDVLDWECAPGCPVGILNTDVGTLTSGKLEPHHQIRASENSCMSGPNQARHPTRSFGGNTGTVSRFFKQVQNDPRGVRAYGGHSAFSEESHD